MFGLPKLFHEVPADVILDRQKWFWRRILLFTAVLSLLAIHGITVLGPLAVSQNWPLFAVVAVELAAIVWLVTIYFTNVNDATQLTKVVSSIGHAVGDARDGVPTPPAANT